MTEEASSQPNDSTSGEHSLSSTSDAMGDAADAAAAAALVALPQPAAAAAGEFIAAKQQCQLLSVTSLCSQSVSMGCMLLCVAESVRRREDGALLDEACKHPLCERCNRQLRGHHTRNPDGPGRVCHPRCPKRQQQQQQQQQSSPASVSQQSRKRRATSDPGESPEPAATQAITRRVVATEPASTSRKQYNTRREQQIMRLLDDTHARRIAAEEAATGAAAAGERGATHAGFTLTFVP
jgi:hypothetical protein